jgi:hypothetical protein
MRKAPSPSTSQIQVIGLKSSVEEKAMIQRQKLSKEEPAARVSKEYKTDNEEPARAIEDTFQKPERTVEHNAQCRPKRQEVENKRN